MPTPQKPRYDNNGNIQTITDNVDQTQTQTFTYDWLNRLATAAGAYGNPSYNPDAAGNIDNAGTAKSGYNQQQALTYDYDNRVTSATTGSGSASFVYDYTGARVKKMSGANLVTYVSKLYEIRNGAAMKHIFAGGRRIASISGGSTYFYHPDHIGSLRIATDMQQPNPNRVQTVAYDPYGNVDPNHSSGSVLPYTYTGKELDAETGLYYFGARYYDAAQGRFMTPDTTVQSPGDPQTLNRYAYARNNPLLYTDPSGHIFLIDDIIIGIIIGAAIGATISAITGGNILMGALTGAISGAAFALAGGAIQSWGLIQQIEAGNQLAIAEASAIHFAAGAASGAINAGITGGNVGLSSLTSGISEGISYGVGAELGMIPGTNTGWYSKLSPEQQFFSGLAVRTGVGSLVGGATAEMMGGKFLQGMGQGAWTAAYGFLFNECGDLLNDGFPRTIPADADPDTYRPYDEGQAWATAVNDPNFELQMAGIMALPLAPLTIAAGPELYSLPFLYPGAAIAGANFLQSWNPGVTPPPMVGPAGGAGGLLSMFGSVRGWW